MSIGPSGGWPPAHDAYSPPGPHPAQSLSWRVTRSLWLLLPIFGCGCLGGAAFIFLGIRARRRSWWIAGIVYVLVGAAYIVTIDTVPQDSAASDWAVGAILACWLACIVHACLINPEWLRWQATRVPWYNQLHHGPMQPAPAWPGPALAPITPAPASPVLPTHDPGAFWAAGPASATPGATAGPPPLMPPAPMPPPAMAPVAPAASTPVEPIDINAADAAELATLPGVDAERAYRAVLERTARGGFGSVDEFATVAGLAPHELIRLRAVATCTKHQEPPARPGRVLDL
jgi:hypothetical protein